VTDNPRLNSCRAIVKPIRDGRVTEERHCNGEANEPSADHVTLGQKEGGRVVPHLLLCFVSQPTDPIDGRLSRPALTLDYSVAKISGAPLARAAETWTPAFAWEALIRCQWDISTGRVMLCRIERVTPPSSSSRTREGPDAHGELPGADISLHLARHGVKAEIERTVSAGIPAGDVLLSRAADLGADLLVIGAYGHSRVRELLLGGVTRSILQSMTLPVLMSH
jgi:nucleotide-binding universal stress UspA family protein